jgi:hypothetical protein
MNKQVVVNSIHQANALLPDLGIGQTLYVGTSAYQVRDLDGKVLVRVGAVVPNAVRMPEPAIKATTRHGFTLVARDV